MNIRVSNSLRLSLKNITRKFGFEIIRFIPKVSNIARLKHFLSYFKFNVVFDVGANAGQYASNLREIGYEERIISFEPVSSAYSILKLKSDKDINWEIAPRCAIGDQDSEIEINVSNNTQCSSLFALTDEHLDAFPNSAYSTTEKVQVFKLDTVAKNFLNRSSDVILLKIDTQGYEKQVIEGAKEFLPNILGLQVELSLTHLYKDEVLYDEMILFLSELGFNLYAVIPGFTDTKTGKMLQMDGLFLRN
jgi:FkbM family methyltransferase